MAAGTSLALVCSGGYSKHLNIVNIPLMKQVGSVSWDSEYFLAEYSWCLTSLSGRDPVWLDGASGNVLGQQDKDTCCGVQLIFADHMQQIHVLRTSRMVDGQ